LERFYRGCAALRAAQPHSGLNKSGTFIIRDHLIPPWKGGIKGGKSDMGILKGIFFLGNVLVCQTTNIAVATCIKTNQKPKDGGGAPRRHHLLVL